MNAGLLLVALALAAGPAASSDAAGFGAIASAPLPRGSLAVYGLGGYPELRAGFRQGLQGIELTGEAGIDYLRVKGFGLVGVRAPLLERGALRLAADLSLGGFADAGARLADEENERAAGLAFSLGSLLTWKTSWPVAWLAYLRIPLELPLTEGGHSRLTALLGGGAEVAVSNEYYVVFSGGFGPEIRRPPEQGLKTRLAVEAMVGFGYRVF